MFDSHSTAPVATLPAEAEVTIFMGRAGFESGVTRLLDSAAAAAGECAVLYVGLAGPALSDPEAARKTLRIVAEILRARVKAGALAYLGEGRFSVLLRGVSGRDAVHYCREVLSVFDEIRLQWQGEVLRVDSWIGGAMVEAHHDGLTLLEAAEHAAAAALRKPGRHLHMTHDQDEATISVEEESDLPTHLRAQAAAAFAARAA
jgi:GGDEF domain-containing protein